jgi:hypothetical protein
MVTVAVRLNEVDVARFADYATKIGEDGPGKGLRALGLEALARIRQDEESPFSARPTDNG